MDQAGALYSDCIILMRPLQGDDWEFCARAPAATMQFCEKVCGDMSIISGHMLADVGFQLIGVSSFLVFDSSFKLVGTRILLN